MKEPWKKTCNGKVVITLNDEKTTPTEVEVPVDLNWGNQYERKSPSSKTLVLVGVILLLGLSLIALFKVQNLVYSMNYMTWRMQSLESAVGDNNNDVKMIKYKLSLDDEDLDMLARVLEPQALVAAKNNQQQQQQQQDDNQDLKLSESQNKNHKLGNSLIADNDKSLETPAQVKAQDVQSSKASAVETKNVISETDELNHPNPADPKELNRPYVEHFDTASNDDEIQSVQKVLARLNIFEVPKENIQIIRVNKMDEPSNENQKTSDESFLEDILDTFFRKVPIMFQPPLPPQQPKPKMLEDKMVPPPSPAYNEPINPFDILKGLFRRPEENRAEQENSNFMIHFQPISIPEPVDVQDVRQDSAENNNNQFDIIRPNSQEMQPNQPVDMMKLPMSLLDFPALRPLRISYVKGTINSMDEANKMIPLDVKEREAKVQYPEPMIPEMPPQPLAQAPQESPYAQKVEQPRQSEEVPRETHSIKLQPVDRNQADGNQWDMSQSTQYAMPMQN